MASDFVRNIKNVKNIDILSRNITTENDLISTTDGDVYVVTKKGYKKITNIDVQDFENLKNDVSKINDQSSIHTSDISDLKTTTENNTSDISDLKTTTENNTSDISDLKITTENNTSDISDLKTTTEKNTLGIEDLQSVDTTSWQKHKLTRNDGYISRIDNPDMEQMNDFDKTGVYYIYHPENFLAGENGYMSIYSRSSSYSKAIFYPFNSEKIFSNRKYGGEWKGWEELTGITRTVLFDGSSSNTGDVITLNQPYNEFTELKIKVERANTREIFNFDAKDDVSFVISYINVFDNNSNGKLYEMIIDKKSPTELEIESQRSITISGDSSNDSAITILKIWGVK